jgi:SAM-dependent methyltransferase
MLILILKSLLTLHGLIYQLISRLAVLAQHGVHPKHALLQYHDFFLDNIKEQDMVLDVGCGRGLVARTLAAKARKIVAIDINERAIAKARRIAVPNIEYLLGDARVYDFCGRFDAVVLSNVLEHIAERVTFLKRLGLLSDKILVRVPLLDRDWLTLYKKELGLEYRLDKTHFIEYTLESFTGEAAAAGLGLVGHHVRFGELYAVLTKKV